MRPLAAGAPSVPRLLALLRRHLGRAVAVTYLAAAVLPGPGLRLRHPHATGIAELPPRAPQLLLALVLFGAGLQVPLRELRWLLRHPDALLAGLALHLDTRAGASVTPARGMNKSSASAVLITTTLPDRPHILLPVPAYGLLQKVAAGRVVRTGQEANPAPGGIG
jgi:predicted Na+-dependent transporter